MFPWDTLSPGLAASFLCQEHQEGTHHGIRGDPLDKEPSWDCEEQGLGQEEKLWHQGRVWTAAPSQGGRLVRVPSSAPGANGWTEEARAAVGNTELLPTLHAPPALATLAQPVPHSQALCNARSWDSDTGTQHGGHAA